MRNYLVGVVVTVILAAIPIIWFLPIAAQHDAAAAFSQYLGSVALIVMAISMVISTRLPGVSLLFGPLDRAYVLHKWFGVVSMGAILLHDTIDADMDGLGAETLLVGLGETLGELSLYGLLALVLLSIATFTPYKLWKWTHRLMGAFFIAGAIHYLLILRPFELSEPLGMYVGVFCIAGILAYIYATLAGLFSRGRKYTVTTAVKTGDALAITMKPKGRSMRPKAGQFAFVSFDKHPEPHPFTISKVAEDGSVRFTIKSLGDHTQDMQSQVKAGDSVSIKGPYGAFTRTPGQPEIWIAAGVGITPFASWANELDNSSKPVHLFYSVRNTASASHLDELESAGRDSALQLHLHETGSQGRLTPAHIIKTVGGDLSKATVSFCGPAQMRDDLQKSFSKAGLKPANFHSEMFELRSGIGFRKMLAWGVKQYQKRKQNGAISGARESA